MTEEVPVKTSNHNRYLVKSLVHASRVLEAFQSAGDVLRLRDVVTRTGFNKGMCFRLLYTLHQCGFLDKVGENHYRLASEVRRRRLYRIGYAAQGLLPVTFPLITALGFNPIWFGVIVVKLVEIGLITPPVGMNVFVVSGATGVPVGTVFRGTAYLLAWEFITLVLLLAFPAISTWLPSYMIK